MILAEKILELTRQNRGFAVATIVKTGGSVPGKVGFKILVEADGGTTGTVGGGELEKEVIQECHRRMSERKSSLQEYILTEKEENVQSRKGTKIIPMMCNGRATVFYEIHHAATTVYVMGGGHVGQALTYFLHRLGYYIILIDNRKEFANSQMNPKTHQIICQDYLTYAREVEVIPDSFFVVLTHGHQYDYDIARIILERKLPLHYLGIIASKSKAHQIKSKLIKDLGEKVDLSVLYTPIGLDIGGDSDIEIALSIAAEIQAVSHEKKVPHMSRKT